MTYRKTNIIDIVRTRKNQRDRDHDRSRRSYRRLCRRRPNGSRARRDACQSHFAMHMYNAHLHLLMHMQHFFN